METKGRVTVYLLVIFMCLCLIKFYQELNDELQKQRFKENNIKDVLIVEYEKTLGYKPLLGFQESILNISKIQAMKRKIRRINDEQHIINKDITSLNVNTTVLVILVHNNISYLTVFLDSIEHVVGINRSLLIFAHDYYDEEINSAIRNIKCAKVMQIFYPFSTQLHPNIYPGKDFKFCEKFEECYESRKRNPNLAQTKLFWWWVTNQVFDHIDILKNYNGYVYFLETETYLASDFIDLAKVLEHVQKLSCPECRILSLGALPPRTELYQENTIVKSIWGWSPYSNSGIGFNRTTWEDMRGLKQQFCSYGDSSWENSLKQATSKSQMQQFFMLFPEAPHFFPTTGCGAFNNGTGCDLNCNLRDILKFTSEVRFGSYLNYNLKFDNLTTPNDVTARGCWGDARDIELCIFFTNKQRFYL